MRLSLRVFLNGENTQASVLQTVRGPPDQILFLVFWTSNILNIGLGALNVRVAFPVARHLHADPPQHHWIDSCLDLRLHDQLS